MKNAKLRKGITVGVTALLAVVLIALVAADALSQRVGETDKYGVAMGTVITQRLFSKKSAEKESEDITDIINALEDKISWRKEGSDIFTLNRNYIMYCDSDLKAVLDASFDVWDSSGGAFDITVGKLTSLWNIGDEGARVPSEKEIENALDYVDGSKVRISGDGVTVMKGQMIDLGAVGKGLACDKIKAYLENTDISGAVISVGGSVLLYGENTAGEKWKVAVRDPRGDSGDYVGTVMIDEGCVSTSGDYERVLEADGKSYHHIIDPKTGMPADSGLISVTVVSDSGFTSDALSTACFVLGKEEGMKLLEKYNAQGIFIDSEYTVYVSDGLKGDFSLNSEKYTVSE